jgi:outer membrane protein OmpA-like peptidoglycan-associated protein
MNQRHCWATAFTLCTLFLNSVVAHNLQAQDDAQNNKPTIRAMGAEANGVEVPVVQIRVDEYLSRQIHPLLNYIFFDDNSAELPQRYIKMTDIQAENFRPERLFNRETLDVYYDVLNVIGYRLKGSTAPITITGCNSNVGPEKGNKDLSTRRAQAVKQYLESVWKVDPARITVQSRDLPEKPSTSKESPAESDAENRRVEITAAWEVVQPVMISDTLREATPPIVRFYSKVQDEAVPDQYSIFVKQRGKTLKNIAQKGLVKPVVDWKINKDRNSIPLDTIPMTYELEIRYTGDKTNEKSKRMTLPVQQITVQKKRREKLDSLEKDRYSMILFPFGSAKVEDANARIVEFIKSEKRLRPKSRVTVTGYTDIVGSAAANLKISQDRAKAIAAALGVDKGGFRDVKVEGRGKNLPLLYENNELPEARFYCRTVIVDILNPADE